TTRAWPARLRTQWRAQLAPGRLRRPALSAQMHLGGTWELDESSSAGVVRRHDSAAAIRCRDERTRTTGRERHFRDTNGRRADSVTRGYDGDQDVDSWWQRL